MALPPPTSVHRAPAAPKRAKTKYAPGQSPADKAAARKANAIRAHDALNKPGLIGGILSRAPGEALHLVKSVPRVVRGTPHVVKEAAVYTKKHPSKVLSTDAAILSGGIGNEKVQKSVRTAFATGSPAPLKRVPKQIVAGYAGGHAANQPTSLLGIGEIAAAFPIFRGPKAIAELAKTVAAGEKLSEAGRASRQAYRTSTPLLTGSRKVKAALSKLSPRSRAIEQELHGSAERQQLFDVIDQIETPELAASHKAVFDAAARRAAHATGVPPARYYAGLHTILHPTEHVPEHVVNPQTLMERAQETHSPEMTQHYKNLGRQLVRQFPGALPEGHATATRLGRLLQDLRDRAIEAEQHRHWYSDSAKAILQHVGGNTAEAERLAKLFAIYSPRAKVYDETTWNNTTRALGAYDEFKKTGKVSDRWSLSKGANNDWQTKYANNAMNDGPDWDGIKTNSFYSNFLKTINPDKHNELFGPEGRVTIDTWMRRVFGYLRGSKASHEGTLPGIEGGLGKGTENITPAMYEFMAKATAAIAHELGWTPDQAQAAIWTSIKAELEGTPLSDAGIDFATGITRTRESMAAREAVAPLFDPATVETMAPGAPLPKAPAATPEAKLAAFLHRATQENNPGKPVTAARIRDTEKLLSSGKLGDHPMALAYDRLAAEVGYKPSSEILFRRSKGTPLRGLPPKGKPNAELQDLARDYTNQAGISYHPPRDYATVDPENAQKIADEYHRALDWNDPKITPAEREKVIKSYEAFIAETMDQYQALIKAGYRFEFYPAGRDPYASPWDAMRDLNQNKHLYVFPTEGGFGSNEAFDASMHPLLGQSGVEWGGKPATFNDIFRGVHDVFGHNKEGVGFRADGEENAWRSHVAMYSPEARGAMTSETRGQNSWVNFGPHGEANRTASQADTVYADQKATVLPDWVNQHDAPLRRQGGGNILGAYDPVTRTIHYAQGSDTTTIQHEFFHDLLHQIRGTPEEAVFGKWAGAKVKDGKVIWDTASHEKFVEGMLHALHTGAVLPGPLKEAVRSLAANLESSGKPIPDDVAAGLNRILGQEPKTPAQMMREGTAGARSQFGKQKRLRSEELAARSAKLTEIFRTVADPEEAHALAKAAMRGELPKIQFNGLKDFTPELVTELKRAVWQHPSLLNFMKVNLADAIQRAHEGAIPTPYQMSLIEHVFGKNTAYSIAQNAVVRGGWGDRIINALNIPRTLMATADLSAVARQGLVAGASHPLLVSKSIGPMLRAFKSPHYYEEMMQAIKRDEDYHLALAAHVSFTDLGHETALAAHEEAFGSDYAAQIPGIGHAVKASGRAYVGFLNKVRMDLFKEQLRIAKAAGTNYHDERWLADIGKVINAATGRGTIGERAEHIMPALNTMLFSPRLMLSRINYLNPVWYVKLSSQARREALRGLFATAGAVTTVLYLFSRIPGVDVGSLDPRSADFGKLKAGNTRIDVAGGFQQYVRIASELATNTKVTAAGNKEKLGSGYGIPSRLDETINFALQKGAPPVTMGASLLRGHDAVGNPVTPGSVALNNFVPLLVQDSYDLYKEHHDKGALDGVEYALGGFGLGMWGVGLQTYGPRNPVPKLESKLQKDAKAAGVSTVLPAKVKDDIPWYRKASDAGGLDQNKSHLARLKILAKLADEKAGGGTKVQDAVAQRIKTEGQAAAALTYVETKMLYPSLARYQSGLRSLVEKAKAHQPVAP